MALFSLFSGSSSPLQDARLARIERKLDQIIEHLGIAPPPPSDDGLDDVRALVAEGPSKKISAIALYRKKTGASLAEAKRAIENDF